MWLSTWRRRNYHTLNKTTQKQSCLALTELTANANGGCIELDSEVNKTIIMMCSSVFLQNLVFGKKLDQLYQFEGDFKRKF